MDCEKAVALLSARLDHEIPTDDGVPLDLHLRDCPSCRAVAEALALQHQELRGAFEARREAAASTAAKVNAQLPAATASKPKPAAKRGRAVRAALVLAAVAAAVAAVLLTRRWVEPPGPSGAAPGSPLAIRPLPPGVTLPLDELMARPRPEAPPPTQLAVGETVETKAGEKRRLALPDGSVLFVNENTKARLDDDQRVTLTAGTVYVEVSPYAEMLPHNAATGGATFSVDTPYEEVGAFGSKFEVKANKESQGVFAIQGSVKVLPTNMMLTINKTMPADGGVVEAGQEFRSSWPPAAAPRASHELDWTRDLMAAAESPLVPASEYDGGALIAVDPYGQEAKLSLRNYHIDVHIEDGFARTTIDQTYFNSSPWRLEGTFYFPLPPDASLSRLAMYVDGNLMDGGMTDRDWGEQVYEKVVRSKRDPALLEWVDGSTFKMRVFPLEGRQEKRIILSYTQRLSTLYGRTQYRFPAGHSIQVVDHWSFHALVRNGGGLAWNSPTHPKMRSSTEGADLVLDAADSSCKVDRDVEVDMADPQEGNSLGERIRFSTAEADGAGYLMVRFRPELPAAGQRPARKWVFLFESSADRDPLLARTQIEIIRNMLDHIDHDDRFVVMTAGTQTHLFQPQPQSVQPATAAAAVAFLEQTHLIGALDLGRALTDLRPFLDDPDHTYLVHVGSGYTAMGRRQEALADLIPAGVHYIGIGVGKHWNRSWMKQQAESSGGYFTQINPDEPVAWRAFDLVSTLNTPRLLHVTVTPGGDAEQPRFLTDQSLVAQGEEVCAVAQVARSAGGSLTLPQSVVVTGVLDGQPYRRELPVQDVAPHADYLPRTWAKLEIDRLLAEDAAGNREKIVALSKAMYVMTPFTSLLVLENEEMYKEFKVDRGRKDHWAMYPCPDKIPIVFEPDPTQPIDVRNAPKTPKPVANLVLPTVVARATPQILGGAALTSQEKGKLLKRLKDSLSTQERLIAQIERGPREIRREGKPDAILDAFGRPQAFEPQLVSGVFQPQGFINDFNPGKLITGLPPPGTLTSDLGYYPPAQALVVKAEARIHTRMSDGRIIVLGNVRTRQNVILRQVPASSSQALPDLRFGATYDVNGVDQVDHATRLYSAYVDYSRTPPLVLGTRTVDATMTVTRADAIYRRRIEVGWTPALLYQPPSYTGDARLFSDLVSYAPGLNTSDADILAVLDAEAAPNLADAPGHIDPDARRLIDQARRPRWRTLTLGGGNTPALVFHFDGAGRYAYDHTLPLGLHERVVCDGETLWHLYPELGLAARRTVSRFHRAEVAGLTPWTLPPAEDLARGADVESIGAHTIALVPLGARTRRTDDDKPAPYYRLILVFADDGRLVERRQEEMPAGKVVGRETYDDNGGVRVLDGEGKELAADHAKVADAPAPDLTADVSGLVVVRMPLRSRDRVFADCGLDASRSLGDEMNACYPYLEEDQAVELLVGAMTEGKAAEAQIVLHGWFEEHGDVRRGLFPLLSAAGVNVCQEPAFQKYLMDHKDDPLTQYFALLGNPVYDILHRGSTLDLGQRVGAADGFLRRLAEFHDLETRWNDGVSAWTAPALRRADEQRTFDFIRRNRGNVLGWALQIHVQGRVSSQDNRLHSALADTWSVLAGDDPDAYTARYEQARCLFRADRREEACKLFLDLYSWALKSGGLPPIDGDFRDALREKDDQWSALMLKTAADFIDKNDRPTAVLLAWQCQQAGDEPLSDNLLAFTLDHLPKGTDGTQAMLAAVEYLWATDQLAQADEWLSAVTADPANASHADLWRLAAQLAERRQMPYRAAHYLETALDLEYRDLPPVIDLQAWRADYGKVLSHYQSHAALLRAAGVDVAARTIAAADRWRAHDPEADAACNTAATILRALGREDAAWEYLTTPAAIRAGAVSWPDAAQQLGREGDVELADRSFATACEQNPEDALLVWQRAMSLRRGNRKVEADALLHRLAEGEWPERFQWVKAQARWQLDRK